MLYGGISNDLGKLVAIDDLIGIIKSSFIFPTKLAIISDNFESPDIFITVFETTIYIWPDMFGASLWLLLNLVIYENAAWDYYDIFFFLL